MFRFSHSLVFCLFLFLVATVAPITAQEVPIPISHESVVLRNSATSQSGWLSIIWGDAEDGASYHTIYMLATDEGQHIELLLDEHFVRETHLLTFNGQYVTVNGRFASDQRTANTPFHVTAIQQASNRVPTAPDIDGSQPWVSIMCKFADSNSEPRSLSYFQNMYSSSYPGLDHYWREQSYNIIDVQGSDAFGWYTLPSPWSSYVYDRNGDGTVELDHNKAFNDCVGVADPFVYFPDYVGINLMFNENLDCCAWGGSRTVTLDGRSQTWRTTWEPPWGYNNITVMGHEMGHGFGLPHSSGQYGEVYDNAWDVMSNAWYNCGGANHPTYGCMGQHTISTYKDRLGWIANDEKMVVNNGESATVSLTRLAFPTSNDYRMVKIPIGGSSSHFYTVEVRDRVGYDSKLPDKAVIIHEVINNYAYIIDIDGDGDTSDAGAIWDVGETFTDSANEISVKVDSEISGGFVVTVTSGNVDGEVSLYDVTLADENWQFKDHFLPGETIRWIIFVESTYAQDVDVEITFDIRDPNNSRIFYWNGILTKSNGVSGWYFTSTAPDQPLGEYTFIGSLDYQGQHSQGSITYLVEPETYDCNNITQIPTQECRALEAFFNDTDGASWGNWFTTGLPCDDWDGLACSANSIIEMSLSGKGIEGTVSPELDDLSNLETLNLSNNRLTGGIPSQFGNLGNLTGLILNDNRLTGSIPSQLGNATNIDRLILYNNRLGGELPTDLGDLTKMESLFLQNNQFEGDIPASLRNYANVQDLDLGYNKLTASHNGLISFLNDTDPDWDETQTVPPTNIVAAALSQEEIDVTWTPIAYRSHGGYYEVCRDTSVNGSFSECGETATKSSSSYQFDGLETETTYYVKARSYTPAHGDQQNALWSDFSPVEMVTTDPACYSLSVSADPAAGGSVAVSPEPDCEGNKYSQGVEVTLEAISNQHYLFTGWGGDISSGNSLRTLTMDRDYDVVAQFEILCYDLRLRHWGNGTDPAAEPTRSEGCAEGEYLEGEVVELTAVPDPYWYVLAWRGTDDDNSTSTHNVVTMPVLYDVEVFYGEYCNVLTVQTDPVAGGIVEVDPVPNCEPGTYLATTQVTLTAVPSTGYGFAGWTGDSTASEPSIDFDMTADRDLVAHFEPLCYPLTLLHTGNGAALTATPTQSPSCDVGEYVYGEAITLLAQPDAGWYVSGWEGTAVSDTTSLDNTVSMPAAAHTATVHYTQQPTIALDAAQLSVDEGAGTAVFTVSLSDASAQTVSVAYQTQAGTATTADYEAASGVLTFAPGQTTQSIMVNIVDDALDEADETAMLLLDQPANGTLGSITTAVFTIVDNDPAPTITFSSPNYEVSEADGQVELAVQLAAPSGQVVAVDYATSAGTAVATDDYQPQSGTLTFAVGQTSQTITIPLVNDGVIEHEEAFAVRLSQPQHGTLGNPAETVVTIQDDDGTLTVQFSQADATANEGDGVATIDVVLNAPASWAVEVRYATSDGTAVSGQDYGSSSGVLHFQPGETRQTITIPVYDDDLYEASETVIVTLSNWQDVAPGGMTTAVLTIIDNEQTLIYIPIARRSP